MILAADSLADLLGSLFRAISSHFVYLTSVTVPALEEIILEREKEREIEIVCVCVGVWVCVCVSM